MLIIDDRVPHPDLGRLAAIFVELSKMPINVTFYPLLYTDDSWTDIHSTLPQNIEVMRALGKEGFRTFVDVEGYYQFILVSRNHNMEFFRHILMTKKA